MISHFRTTLYWNHIVPDLQGSAAHEIPNHWISPSLRAINWAVQLFEFFLWNWTTFFDRHILGSFYCSQMIIQFYFIYLGDKFGLLVSHQWWHSLLFLSPTNFLQNYHLTPQDRPFRLFRSVSKCLKLYLNGSTCVKTQILWILRRPNCKDQNRHPSVPSLTPIVASVSLQAEVFLVKAKTKIEVFSAYWESSYSHFLDFNQHNYQKQNSYPGGCHFLNCRDDVQKLLETTSSL